MQTVGLEILDLVGESVFLCDLDGRIIAWNVASETLYGHSPSTARGQLEADLLRTVYPEPLAGIGAKALEAGLWEGEAQRMTAAGKPITVLVRWAIRKDEAGKAIGILQTGHDITGRKQAEAAFRDSEHRYRNLFRAMAASFWELDFSTVDQMLRGLLKAGVEDLGRYLAENPDFVRDMMRATRVIDVNEQTVALFGCGRDKAELLGSVEPFWPEESTQVFARGILAGAARKPHFTVECKLRRIDGSTFDALFTAAYPRESMGKGSLLIGVIDITERKQAFAKLEASERRYRDLFHYMPIGLTQIDASKLIPLFRDLKMQGVTDLSAYIDEHPDFLHKALTALEVEEVNQHNLDLFGANSADEMRGPIARYWQPGLDTIRRSIEARFRGEEFFQEETKVAQLDGTVVDVLFSTARPGAIADKSLVGFIDISERKKSEEALRYSEYRYRNMFQAMAASFWELDFSGATDMVRALKKSGVTDLRGYFTANPAFVRDMMRATRIVDVNEQTMQVFGGNKAELGEHVEPFWPEESTHVYAESYLQAIERKPNFSAECKLRRADGGLFDGLFTVAYPPRELGRSTTMIGVIDITTRKESERALRASEQRYRHLFHHMPIALWQMNSSGSIALMKELRAQGVADLSAYIDEHPDFIQCAMAGTQVEEVNRRTVELFGGQEMADMFVPAERFWRSSPDTYREILEARWRGDAVYESETKMNALDGRPIDGLFTVAFPPALTDLGISINGFVDMTARKESERALRASEERYQNLFQAMAVSFWEVDFSGVREFLRGLRASGVTDFRRYFSENPSGVRDIMRATRILDVNDQTLALFGRGSKEDLLGTTEPMWPEESWPAYAEAILSALDDKPSFSVETKLTRLDGSLFDAHFTVWYSSEDRSRGLAGVLDISERVRAQAMLSQVQADFAHAARVSMLGELTASIAHEVNQPLAAIATNGEAGLRWLNRAEPDIDEVRELTGHMVADARRAAQIISRVRAMAARRAPEQALLSLGDIVEEAMVFLRHEIQTRRVVTALDLAPGLPPLAGDRTQLQQVIVNLAINAMQAMAQTGSPHRAITIRTGLSGAGMLQCRMEDNGPGISEEHLPRLFESFFTTKDNGMGMGLPICRSIIEAHGGAITASNNPSGGACFSFTVPVASQ